MIDQDTFLTTLYVMVDDFCQSHLEPEKPQPGPHASLSRSEVITLALFGQWGQFPGERAFYRYAERHLRQAVPHLPNRSQFNRLQRTHREAITALAWFLVETLAAQDTASEVLESTAVLTRDAKRRGLGWVAGPADIGWSNRPGWYEGVPLLLCVTQEGGMTGFGFARASPHDQYLAAPLFAARHTPSPGLSSVGKPAHGSYVADKGFAGDRPGQQWQQRYQVDLITPPHPRSKQRCSKALRRWLAGVRPIIETVNDKLLNTFRLAGERPHDLTGFQARLAAQVSLHNFCIWINQQLERPALAFAELLEWYTSHRNSHQTFTKTVFPSRNKKKDCRGRYDVPTHSHR